MKNNKKYRLIIVLFLFTLLQVGLFNTIISLSAQSSSQTIEDGTYVIKSAINNKYVLDIAGASNTNGANAQIYESNNSNAQKFTVKSLGNGYYTITSVNSKKVLDVAGAAKTNGTNVQQYESNNSDAQKWMIKDAGNGYYSIVSKLSSNLYMDIACGLAKNGENVQVYAGNGSNAQKFKFEKVTNNNTTKPEQGTKTIADGNYTIKSMVSNNYVLDIAGASSSNGANVQLYQSNNSNAQKFTVKYLNDGTYSITAMHSKKALDVAGGGKTNGTNVQQYQSNNSDAQKWIIKSLGNDVYSIISKSNNLYIDIDGGIAQNGRNIQVYAGNNSNAQKFKFEAVKETTNNNNNNNNNNSSGNANVTSGPIKDGTYSIESAISSNYVLDVNGGFKSNGANVQLYQKQAANRQKFNVKSIGNGYYTITAVHSNKVLDVAGAGKTNGTNVQQYEFNDSDAQKWLIKDVGNGYYSIVSKLSSNLCLDISCGLAKNGENVQVYAGNGSNAQKFKFVKPLDLLSTIDTKKYPGYKEKIKALMDAHPGWNFELLYTGLKFDNVIAGETSLHSRNLVPTNYGGEWVCQVCGTKLYDSGWYCASRKSNSILHGSKKLFNRRKCISISRCK